MSRSRDKLSPPPKRLKAVAYFKGTQERVPNTSEIVYQQQSGEPMAWRIIDKWGNGKWTLVEWAS